MWKVPEGAWFQWIGPHFAGIVAWTEINVLLYHKHEWKCGVSKLHREFWWNSNSSGMWNTQWLKSWQRSLMRIKWIIHRADFPTMSHVASADFTSFVSTPTNPIFLPKPTVGLSGSYLKADHNIFAFGLAHTKFLILLLLFSWFVVWTPFNNVTPIS